MLANYIKIFGVLFCLLIVQFAQAADKKAITVGAILPFSGSLAGWGQAIKNGMLMAYDEFSDEEKSRIRLVFEDNAGAQMQSITVLNKLINSDDVDVVLNVTSGTGYAMAPILEQKKIPFISISSSPRISNGREYVVNFMVTPEEESKVLYRTLVEKGYKKIARVGTEQEGTIFLSDEFDRVNKGRIEVVLDERFDFESKDFRSYLLRLRTKKDIDGLLVVMLPGQGGVFVKQAREMGIKIPIFGYHNFEDLNEVKASAGALIGSWYIAPAEVEGKFFRVYQDMFPGADFAWASNGHDALKMIAEAISKTPTRAGIAQYLRTVKDFNGVMGTYSATGDNRFTFPAVEKKVTEKGFEQVGN